MLCEPRAKPERPGSGRTRLHRIDLRGHSARRIKSGWPRKTRPSGVELILTPEGANDVYVVRNGNREVLLPAVEPVIKNVDVTSGIMTVDPLPGLLPEDPDED